MWLLGVLNELIIAESLIELLRLDGSEKKQ